MSLECPNPTVSRASSACLKKEQSDSVANVLNEVRNIFATPYLDSQGLGLDVQGVAHLADKLLFI